ncbi:MAG: hypothetical protein Q9177_002579 [Variospora cf. flavescens]
MSKVISALGAAVVGAAAVLGQECALGTAKEIAGNWYCSEVKAITYSNFPGTGSYNKVVDMDPKTGQCTTEKHAYSGSLAPLSEELSVHFRGPLRLRQLAVYYPDADSNNLRQRSASARNFHGHALKHLHLHHPKRNHVLAERVVKEERAVGDIVTATVNGQVVHWINQYAGSQTSPSTATAQPAAEVSSLCPYCNVQTTLTTWLASSKQMSATSVENPDAIASAAPSPVNPLPPAGGTSGIGGTWSRQAYYNADTGNSDGFTFLNHFGGSQGKPGTADGGPAFGVSLSYASSDGKSAAASPQMLHNQLIEDDVEVIVMSDRKCSGDSCGYTRPDGFAGDHKLFMMEFSMPATGKTGFNGDMPGIWLLNAQIPLTSQYGTNPSCSCWTSGCGEFDLFEVLDSGNHRCKSTLHMAPAGGSSDYFKRPENDNIKAAVLFLGSNESARIQVLDDGQDFDEALAAKIINAIARGNQTSKSSVFRLASRN